MKAAAAFLALAALPATAAAGGFARPNIISARGVGIGGAFTAIADDPSALHFNPAGAAWADAGFMIGVEVVDAPRTYTPIDADGNRGAAQEAKPLVPVPAAGVLVRFEQDDVPSRITFGAGLWNTFGGSLDYDRFPDPNTPAINSTEDLALELAVGGAYEVDDMLAIGAAVRLGLGIFSVDASAHPLDSNLSGVGLGVGATVGVMFRPVDAFTLGAAWRTPLTIATAGSGTIATGGTDMDVDFEHVQHWPQQASFGVVIAPVRTVKVAAQADWTQWSTNTSLVLDFPSSPSLRQVFPLDWQDSFAFRGGLEVAPTHMLRLRAGGYYDSNAVPDRTIERQYQDVNKFGASAGGTVHLGSDWRIDAAFDYALPASRIVPDNRRDLPPQWTADANTAPGEYESSYLTVELAVARRL